MRVIDNNTDDVYEIGLFELFHAWEHTMKIMAARLSSCLRREAELYVGYLEAWKGDEADADDGISYSLDSDALQFFELIDPFQGYPR